MDAREAIERADALRRDGQCDEAASVLLEALSAVDATAEKDRAEIHFRLGNVRIHADDLEAAEAAYKECLALRPKHADALNNLAIVYKRQGKKDQFVKTYRRSIWLSMKSPRKMFGGCRERSPWMIAMRWIVILGLALAVMAILRWIFPR